MRRSSSRSTIQHPEQIAHQQQPGLRRHGSGDGRQIPFAAAQRGGKGHRDAETEGHAQHGLRHRQHAFGIRVGQRDGQRRKRQPHRRRVGGQHEQEGRQGQRCPDGQRFRDADGAARDRPIGGAFDVAVEVAVGHVVDAAAGAAHQHRAQHEHDQ
jgi:hypothetical protein